MSEFFKLKQIYWRQQQSRLPAGYREVEYLEGNGAYIDTGVNGGEQGIAVQVEFMRTGWYAYYQVIWAYVNETTRATRIINRNAGENDAYMYVNCHTQANNATVIYAPKDEWHTLVMNDEQVIVDGAITTMNKREPTNELTKNITMFNSVARTGCSTKIRYMRLYIGNVQVRYFIPCVRTSDNKPGMYDLCGSTCSLTDSPFYINSGTGADFLWKEFDGPAPDEVWYWADDQVTLSSDTNVSSHIFSNGKGVVKFNAPVTTIGNAFNNSQAKKVILPSCVSTIGYGSFYLCSILSSVAMPDSVKIIDGNAFNGCSSLLMDRLPSSLETIGASAFRSCPLISISDIPQGVLSIGASAFRSDTSITSMAFAGMPTSISESAFMACPNLTDIYVPWSEGDVADAPWSATNATIHYNYVAP